MEMSVRLVLLGVAFVIIAGIIWDAVRNRKGKLSTSRLSSKRNKYDSNPQDPDFSAEDELLDEVVTVRTSNKSEAVQINASPSASLSTPVTVIDRTRVDLSGKRSAITKTAYPVAKSTAGMQNRQQQSETIQEQAYAQTAQAPSQTKIDKNDIIVLHVMSKMPNRFNGESLKHIFDDLHLQFGEMNIFHSHEHIDGSGEIQFSIASAVEPGYFISGDLENFETPGLVLFFTRSHPNQSIGAFEMMYRTAKQIALRLRGEVMDDARRPLTSQKIEQYRERVRGQLLEEEVG